MDNPEIVVRFGEIARFISAVLSDQVWNPSSSIQWISDVLPAGEKKTDRGVKMNTHLLLIPRFRMSGVIPPLPNMKWRAQRLMCLYFTLFYSGRGILCSCHTLRLPFLSTLLFEKYLVEIPHIRVSFTDVIKFEALWLYYQALTSGKYKKYSYLNCFFDPVSVSCRNNTIYRKYEIPPVRSQVTELTT